MTKIEWPHVQQVVESMVYPATKDEMIQFIIQQEMNLALCLLFCQLPRRVFSSQDEVISMLKQIRKGKRNYQ